MVGLAVLDPPYNYNPIQIQELIGPERKALPLDVHIIVDEYEGAYRPKRSRTDADGECRIAVSTGRIAEKSARQAAFFKRVCV
jgi:hypothetical protein